MINPKYKSQYNWVERNKEKVKEIQKKYRDKTHQEKKEYRKKNKEKFNKYCKNYRETHKEKIKQYKITHRKRNIEYTNRWRKKNPEKESMIKKLRYARKKGAKGSHTLEEWKNLVKSFCERCVCCGKQEPKIVLTEDHIIPLSKNGTNYINNIQPLCASCNSSKGIKIIKF